MNKRQSRFDAGDPRSGKEINAQAYTFKNIATVT